MQGQALMDSSPTQAIPTAGHFFPYYSDYPNRRQWSSLLYADGQTLGFSLMVLARCLRCRCSCHSLTFTGKVLSSSAFACNGHLSFVLMVQMLGFFLVVFARCQQGDAVVIHRCSLAWCSAAVYFLQHIPSGIPTVWQLC